MQFEDILPLLIKMDQTGFIKNQNSYNNLRHLLNMIQVCQRRVTDGLVVSLDVEKEFDHVEGSYLFHNLHQFGLGLYFINWIKTLYSYPLAAVITNGIRSWHFEMRRGNRQGCLTVTLPHSPLSTLLFTLAIELPAEAICSEPNVFGICTYWEAHKISLCADDILLFLSWPDISVQRVMTVINQFGSFSG